MRAELQENSPGPGGAWGGAMTRGEPVKPNLKSVTVSKRNCDMEMIPRTWP